jgi:hypothetical protein
MAETVTRPRHLKPWPKFRSDAEADKWLQNADLTEYDLETGAAPFREWLAVLTEKAEAAPANSEVARTVKAVKVKPVKLKIVKAGVPGAKASKARKARSVARHRARA